MESLDERGHLQPPHVAYQNGHQGRSSSLRWVPIVSAHIYFWFYLSVFVISFLFYSAIDEEIDLKVIVVKTGMFTMHVIFLNH